MTDDFKFLVTTNEAARMLAIKPATVRKWVERGYLRPCGKAQRSLYFRWNDVTECLEARQHG